MARVLTRSGVSWPPRVRGRNAVVRAAPRRYGGAPMQPAEARLREAFAAEEDRGLVLATRVRLVAIAVIAVWTLIENRLPGGIYYFWIAVAFGVTGVAPLTLRRLGVRGRWPLYVFPALDVALFTAAVLVPNPLDPTPVPA